MRSFSEFLSLGLLALGVLASPPAAGGYGDGCNNINSISYCKAVDTIAYTDVGDSGHYEDVILMDSDSCVCKKKPTSYSGTLAPLNEQVDSPFPFRL